jgi:hypothetical protein
MLRADHLSEGACYSDVERIGIVLGILHQRYTIFERTSIIQKLNELVALLSRPWQRDELSSVLWSLDHSVLDSVRIAIFFENFFKAKLLLDRYTIHKIDRKIDNGKYKPLANRQFQDPISILELGSDIFHILYEKTIEWETLMKPEYKKILSLPPDLSKSLEAVVNMRNNLHYLIASAVQQYNIETIENFMYIRKCFNMFIVKLYNELIRDLKKLDNMLKRELGI